jgi:hypothetical protein
MGVGEGDHWRGGDVERRMSILIGIEVFFFLAPFSWAIDEGCVIEAILRWWSVIHLSSSFTELFRSFPDAHGLLCIMGQFNLSVQQEPGFIWLLVLFKNNHC